MLPRPAADSTRPGAAGAGTPAPRPDLAPAELEQWSALIEQRCGLTFGASRMRFLGWCLWQRMREHGLDRYADYHRLIAREPEGGREWRELSELVVNQESGFFRHPPSFEALVRQVVPELAAERARQGITALTAWSAGCAAGEETWSLAMALRSALDAGGRAGWQLKVCGSDLSERALVRARAGRYPPSRLRSLPEEHRERWMEPVAGDPRGGWRVREELRRSVSFARLNLVRPEEYRLGLQDVVFCQNVLIYFRPEQRRRVVADLAGRLRPGGYLFLAPGEMVGLDPPDLCPVFFDGALGHRRTERAAA